MSRINPVNLSNVSPEQLPRFADQFAQSVVQAINGDLDFSSNFNCLILSLTFTAANANTVFNHGLGRIPANYLQVGQTAGMVVYNGTLSHTVSQLNLRSTAAGTVQLLIF